MKPYCQTSGHDSGKFPERNPKNSVFGKIFKDLPVRVIKWPFSICFSFLMNRKIYDKLCICSNNGNCGFLTFTVLVNFIVFANI